MPSSNASALLRTVASLTHGAFFGIGATVAAALVAPERRSAAIALMFSGLTLANVLGVPFGAWLGAQAGWRSTFWAVCLLGALALAALLLLLPRTMPSVAAGTGGAGWSILRRPRLLGLIGGWAADRWPVRSMAVMLVALAAVELLLALVLPSAQAVVLTIFLWGVSAFAVVPGLQSLVLDEAHDAPALASTLNIGAFNLDNAGAAAMALHAVASVGECRCARSAVRKHSVCEINLTTPLTIVFGTVNSTFQLVSGPTAQERRGALRLVDSANRIVNEMTQIIDL
jgi:DHA1 family inner membrane transport protein